MTTTERPLRIAYSPCPNDTFVFDALAHGRVPDAPALDVTFADIDVTNGMAERGESDVLKVSYAVLPYVLDAYALLPCGGALGRGCGPLVLTRDPGGRVVALADRCTHRGAPLHEGELADGCIVCPWHSSAFELDGGVARGPAQRPQAAYEVEERDGRIWVRRADETHGLRTNPVGV